MRWFHGVIAPLLVQLLAFGLVMYGSIGGGSFVGLAALSAIVLFVPITTLANWVRTIRKPPIPTLRLAVVSHILCLIVPGLLFWMLALGL